MAGIFPASGVVAGRTLNGADPVDTTCEALFYRALCNVKFDPVAMNALISEIVNAVNFYKTYDCDELDNLKDTLEWIRNLCNLPRANINELTDDSAFAGCFSNGPKRLTWGDFKRKVLPCFFPLVTNNAQIMAGSFAGCFNNDSGRVTFVKLKELLSSESTPYSICALPVANINSVNVNTDSLGGCFGGTDKRLLIKDLLSLLGSGMYQFASVQAASQSASNLWNVIEVDTTKIQFPFCIRIGARKETVNWGGGGAGVNMPPEFDWGSGGIGLQLFGSKSNAEDMTLSMANRICPAGFLSDSGGASTHAMTLTMIPGRKNLYALHGNELVQVHSNYTGEKFWIIPRVSNGNPNGSPRRLAQWTVNYGRFDPR